MEERREAKRIIVNFEISSNKIKGQGINFSEKGFGVLTEDELVPATDIPFELEISINGYEDKLSGIANLLFSKKTDNHNSFFYNGFEFVKLDDDNNKKLNKLLSYYS